MSRNPRVHIIGDWDGAGVKRAQRDLGVFERQAAGFSSSFKGSMLGAGAALGGAFAVTSVMSNVVDFMKDAAGAAIQDEKSVAALSKAMDNLGLSSQNAGVEDFIKQMMLATGVADDDLRPAFQRLVTATGDVAQSQKLMQLAMDVSAGTGKDLASVSTALAKASNGNVAALTRLGVPLDANIVKSKDFGAAVETLTSKFGGQAAAAADTYGGRIQKLTTAFDEAKETIGYSLLGAIDNATAAFGGEGGLQSAIGAVSEDVARFIDGVGYAVRDVEDLGKKMNEMIPGLDKWGAALSWVSGIVNPLQSGASAFQDYANGEDRARAQADLLAAAWSGAATIRHAYAGDLNTIGVATRDLAYDTEELKQRQDELTAAISSSQAWDDFREKLRQLDETLKGNTRSLDGWGQGAKENRDVLRSAFADASDLVDSWVKTGKIQAADWQSSFDGLARRIVAGFTRDGFKQQDILAFLGAQDIWTDPMVAMITAAGGSAADAARGSGRSVGSSLADGVAGGIAASQSKVNQMIRQLIAEAEAAARDAADSHSPSRVFAEIGQDVAAGLSLGMSDSARRVNTSARSMVTSAAQTATEAAPTIVPITGGGLPAPVVQGGNSLYVTIQALPGQDYRRLGAEFVEGVGAWVAANGPLPATWVAAS